MRNPLHTLLLCPLAAAALAGCLHDESERDSSEDNATLFVQAGTAAGVPGYIPQGWGWKPNSTLAIHVWNEPCGPDCGSSAWRPLFEVRTNAEGMFGFQRDPPMLPVKRSICGPSRDQKVVFMAKSAATGKIDMETTSADLWFTFQPCG